MRFFIPDLRSQDHSRILSFDDERSVSLKCEYVREKQCGRNYYLGAE